MTDPADRYSKVSRRVWRDGWFTGLGPTQPHPATLWLYLLTTPRLDAAPGLLAVGPATIAEDLGWTAEATEAALDIVEAGGRIKRSQWPALIWLPGFLWHNRPESPNVAISWRKSAEALPECELRDEAIEAIAEGLREAYGDKYADAFVGAAPMSSSKPSGKPSGKPLATPSPNQEQEQEQEEQLQPRARLDLSSLAHVCRPMGTEDHGTAEWVETTQLRLGAPRSRFGSDIHERWLLIASNPNRDEVEELVKWAIGRGDGAAFLRCFDEAGNITSKKGGPRTGATRNNAHASKPVTAIPEGPSIWDRIASGEVK